MESEIIVERVLKAQAEGTTSVESDIVDVDGAVGVCFIVSFGKITDGTPVITVKQGNNANGSEMNTVEGSIQLAATDSDKVVIIDVKKPKKRYVKLVVDRTEGSPSTGCIIDDAIAIKYSGRVYPTTKGDTVADKILLISPDEVSAT